MKKSNLVNSVIFPAIVVMAGLIFGLFTTAEYVKVRGIDYLETGNQLKRHQAVIEGIAQNPWQYRVLAPYLIEVIFKVFEAFHVPHHIAASFIFFRVVQDTLVLLLAYAYYRMLGGSRSHALLGMALLAWGISYSHYDSDLQFNTFFDIIFYLLAGLCILKERIFWILPITLLAAFNRETSGLIPLLPLLQSLFEPQKGSLRKVIPVVIEAFGIYTAVFVTLRFIYGEQSLFIPYGRHPGFALLQYNIFRVITWQQIVATLSIIPLIAILGYKKWTPQLRGFFWGIVPIWFIIHAFSSVMAETRLFLVPQALVFIPGALLSLTSQEDG